MEYRHVSVMPAEVMAHLNCGPGKRVVDCTLGGTGHAGSILRQILPDGLLIGIDQDADAIQNAENILKPYAVNVRLIHDNFVNLPHILSQLNLTAVDGILADLGISLYQIESSGRGFSFRKEEPLDMRMNLDNPVTAEMIVNTASEEHLRTIFKQYGEERFASRIARRIIACRSEKPIRTSAALARIITEAIPAKASAKRHIHPATKVFMAIRIAVNNELDQLAGFVNDAVDALAPGGRICIISFHSLEDRIIKHRLRRLEKGCTCPPDFPACACGHTPKIRVITRKPIGPSLREIEENPMARSARLRVAEKL